MATKEHDKFEIVVALDIGTTYSGYAFQTTEAFKENPLNIQYTQSWNAGRNRMVSHKTPTCLLLNKQEKLCAFGYEAEAEFVKCIANKSSQNCYYFHRFKMKLCKREVCILAVINIEITTSRCKKLSLYRTNIIRMTA